MDLFSLSICWQLKKISIYLFIFWLGDTWDLRFPNQGSNPGPLCLEYGALTTGPPGMSLLASFKCSVMSIHTIFLMGKNSIDYFSKIAFYQEAEPLPDSSLACWDGLSVLSSNRTGVWWIVLSSHVFTMSQVWVSFQVYRCVGCGSGEGLGTAQNALIPNWQEVQKRTFWECCCLHDFAIAKCCLCYHSLQSFVLFLNWFT